MAKTLAFEPSLNKNLLSPNLEAGNRFLPGKPKDKEVSTYRPVTESVVST